jgi:predicted dehydrogenase
MADVKRAGCGAFGDLGTHGLDMLIWWLGAVERCAAQLGKGTGRYPDCEELGEALLRFKSGAIGTLAASWDDWSNPLSHLVSGTEGHIAVINGKVHFTSRKSLTFDGTQPVRDCELPAGLPHAIDQFCDCVVGKPAELVSAREAAYRNVVFDACYEAARETRWVDVH